MRITNLFLSLSFSISEQQTIKDIIRYNISPNSSTALRKVDGRTEARIIQMACRPDPEGHSRWTLLLLEEKARIELDAWYGRKTYDPAIPVVCMDEKPYQVLGEAREPLPMRTGDTGKVDSEYVHNGTCSIFVFAEPLDSVGHVSVREHRTAVDWAEEIRYLVDVSYPDRDRIIPFPAPEARRIAKKLEIHYTSRHGSWLDIAEIELNVMTRQCLPI